MVAARLGNAANRRAFTETFWWGTPGRQDGCMVDLLGRLAGRSGRAADQAVRWDTARDQFLRAREKVTHLVAERTELAQAIQRLPCLRRDAATAYASITAAEHALRALAGQRVAAERSLRAAWHQYGSVMKAVDAHARAKPGLRASLATGFGAGREWRARRAVLDGALRDHGAPVEAAQRAIAEVQAQFAAAVRTGRRGGHAAPPDRRVRRGAGGDRAGAPAVGRHFPSGPEFFCTRGRRGRGRSQGTDCPVGRPGVRRRAYRAVPRRARPAQGAHRRAGAPDQGEPERAGRLPQRQEQPGATVSCLPPGRRCSSSCRLSPRRSRRFPRCSAVSAPSRIGWLLIDEAGQAPPAGGRGDLAAKRTVVVGDPMQLEPVVTLPWGGQQALLRLFCVCGGIGTVPHLGATGRPGPDRVLR